MRKAPQPMGATFQGKTRLLLSSAVLFLCGLLGAGAADLAPDPLAILRSVRISQASQHLDLDGDLRTGPQIIPFRLAIDGPTIRYEFKDPAFTLALHLGEKGAQLQEITHGATEKVMPARFDARVRNSDISYEDLSMRFLYWPKAALLGEETKLLRRCWKIQAEPGDLESQYSRVVLWVEEESGAMLQAEAYDKAGKLQRRFSVKQVQKADGVWILKQMRIEQPAKPGTKADSTPTYLEISGVAK
jgi:hypothetical protein